LESGMPASLRAAMRGCASQWRRLLRHLFLTYSRAESTTCYAAEGVVQGRLSVRATKSTD
jgi:hypothetical protein